MKKKIFYLTEEVFDMKEDLLLKSRQLQNGDILLFLHEANLMQF